MGVPIPIGDCSRRVRIRQVTRQRSCRTHVSGNKGLLRPVVLDTDTDQGRPVHQTFDSIDLNAPHAAATHAVRRWHMELSSARIWNRFMREGDREVVFLCLVDAAYCFDAANITSDQGLSHGSEARTGEDAVDS